MSNLHGLLPPPARTGGDQKWLTLMSIEECQALSDLLGDEYSESFEIPQLMWLANQPPEKLPNSEVFYAQLEVLGFKAFIPIDNWRSVMNDG